MAKPRGQTSTGRRADFLILLIWAGILCQCVVYGRLSAQATSPSAAVTASAPVATLHIYENLVQVPVVVLSPNFELMRPIAPGKFSVSLDSGPPFRASHVRAEGDDPIALSILVEVSGGQRDLIQGLGAAIAGMGTSLRSEDRVSLYVLRQCEIWRPVFDAPPNLAVLGRQAELATRTWPGGTAKKVDAACERAHPLWDALVNVVDQASTLPGRRVVLVFSDGFDKGSKHSWREVKTDAGLAGVSIFGLQRSSFYSDHFVGFRTGPEDLFRSVCELSGGLVFTTTTYSLKRRLVDFIDLLRKRYIVEFPRPDKLETGEHSIEVTLAKTTAFIRPSGVSLPIADPAVLADPDTLLADPSHAPVVGARKPLAPPR